MVDENASVTILQAQHDLFNMFEGLTISMPGLKKHMKTKCVLSLKGTEIYTMGRNADRTLNLRFDIVSQWKAAGVDFQKNFLFIDEASFNTYEIRNRAWAPVGKACDCEGLNSKRSPY